MSKHHSTKSHRLLKINLWYDDAYTGVEFCKFLVQRVTEFPMPSANCTTLLYCKWLDLSVLSRPAQA